MSTIGADAVRAWHADGTGESFDETLSFSEQLVWRSETDQSRAVPFYECPLRLTMSASIGGPLNLTALQSSFDELLRRHPILRSTFPAPGGIPRRVLSPLAHAPFTVLDRAADDEQACAAARHEFLVEEQGTPLDLSSGPLFRVSVLRFNRNAHALFVTVHHIVFDGWSRIVLARELGLLYEAACRGGATAQLPELAASYADYLAWQRTRLAEWQIRSAARESPPAVTARVSTRARPPAAGAAAARAGIQPFTFSAGATEGVRGLCRRQRTTAGVVLLTAFTAVWQRASGDSGLVVGVPTSDRRRAEFEALIGLFINMCVVETAVDVHASFVDALAGVRDAFAAAALAQQNVPYGWLVQSREAASPGCAPPFSVVFNCVPRLRTALQLPSLEVADHGIGGTTTSFADLSLHLDDRGDTFGGRAQYATDRFTTDQVTRLVSAYTALVSRAVHAPQRSIAALMAE